MALERIQKVMAEQGLCSRRAAELIIGEGRVKVNGHPVKLGDKMDVGRDTLMVDGERVRLVKKQEYHYLALYKPGLCDHHQRRAGPQDRDGPAGRLPGAGVPGGPPGQR